MPTTGVQPSTDQVALLSNARASGQDSDAQVHDGRTRPQTLTLQVPIALHAVPWRAESNVLPSSEVPAWMPPYVTQSQGNWPATDAHAINPVGGVSSTREECCSLQSLPDAPSWDALTRRTASACVPMLSTSSSLANALTPLEQSVTHAYTAPNTRPTSAMNNVVLPPPEQPCLRDPAATVAGKLFHVLSRQTDEREAWWLQAEGLAKSISGVSQCVHGARIGGLDQDWLQLTIVPSLKT